MSTNWTQWDRERIARYGEDQPEAFAGWWTETGSDYVVGFTNDVESHVDALGRLLSEPEKLRIVKVRHSYRHLLAVRDSMISIWETATDAIVGVGIDIRGNVVVVLALPERFEEIHAALMATNPDDVRVESSSLPFHNVKSDIKGGVERHQCPTQPVIWDRGRTSAT
jgi:hypothetical protein